MAQTPREKLGRRLQTFNEYVEVGEIDEETGEAVRKLIAAYDEVDLSTTKPEGESYREPNTLGSWLYRLTEFARECNLTTATASELNDLVRRMHEGTAPRVKDEGLTKGTLRAYQAALRKFYGYHDLGVNPSDLPLYDQDGPSVDPNDMLTREEIHRARDAADNPRDKLIFDLLLYTGQRREALCTLRLKDVDPQEGTYRLNPTVDGLKGASERNGNRPLLGATATVREWIEYHPDMSDPNNFLITARPNFAQVDPSDPISGETIRRCMEKIKEKSGIEKPMYPHAMRHNFVTIAKRNHDIDDATVKYLIGHRKDSTVMETTYAHLSGDDHVRKAEEAWGIREEVEDSPFTPDMCPTCRSPLAPSDKACSHCGLVLTPDALAVKDQIEGHIKQSYAQSEPDDERTLEEVMAVDSANQDPDALKILLNRIEELENRLEGNGN